MRSICGKANSPTLSARTFRFKELDSMKRTAKGWQGGTDRRSGGHESGSDSEATFKIPDVPKPSTGGEEVTCIRDILTFEQSSVSGGGLGGRGEAEHEEAAAGDGQSPQDLQADVLRPAASAGDTRMRAGE